MVKPTVELVLHRVHPEDAAQVTQTIERAAQDGKAFEHEYRLLMPDGSVKYVQVVAHASSDESGSVDFVGAVMDVTEQHQARVALERAFDEIKKSQDRLQLVIDTIPTMVWSAPPDGFVDFLSQSWVEYHGFTLEDLGQGGWRSLIHPEDFALFADQWRAALAAGNPWAYELRVRRADGEYRWILTRAVPLRDELRQIVRWYGASIDIHDRKQAEEELRKSEEQWRDVFENNPTMYFMVDAAGTVLSVNPFGAEQLGYQVAELVDQPVLSVFHESDREAVQRHMASCLEQLGRARSWEARKVRKDGRVRWVRETAKAVPRVNGPIVLVACEDITEQKRAEEALRQAQADLAHVSRVTTLGELTASLAHEVNQPITAAVTNANACLRWLAGDDPNLEEARAAATRIVQDGKRAAGVISRIRLLFKKGTPEREMLEVNEVIREMIVLLRSETTRHSILVRTELAPGLPQVMGDRVQLQQLMMNLVMNAIDAMKNVDGARDLAIKSQRAENEQLIVSVSDTGVGLPPQQADQIFNAFFTTKPQGTGMGLSISRSIVESHGGRLWAADNSRRGACFFFTLPTRIEAHEDAPRAADGVRH
jgi:PAS domain S-box-containing protein